jgi:biopolymer transport protein ExbB/TolQ
VKGISPNAQPRQIYELFAKFGEIISCKIIENEEYKYAQTLRKTEIITRVSSGCGLLGTLIPLGPGLASLGTGDVATLSTQLIIAFNTTTVGLSCSLVAYVISKIRKMWYANDISLIYTISEAIMEANHD